jgi:hypothetical protein
VGWRQDDGLRERCVQSPERLAPDVEDPVVGEKAASEDAPVWIGGAAAGLAPDKCCVSTGPQVRDAEPETPEAVAVADKFA